MTLIQALIMEELAPHVPKHWVRYDENGGVVRLDPDVNSSSAPGLVMLDDGTLEVWENVYRKWLHVTLPQAIAYLKDTV